jgi:hypothetical protein
MGRFIPRGLEPHGDRRKALRHIVLVFCLFAAAPVVVSAQPADTLRTFYVPTKNFNIPFSPTDNDPRIDVFLYVSTDGQAYRYVGAAKPAERRFHFAAPGDGWYSFVVQTRDGSGVLRPADVRDAQPSLRVCVDTQRPIITELTNGGAPGGFPILQWKVQDANFGEVSAEYRAASGGDWVPLPLRSQQQGSYPWKPALAGEVEVRMQARDRAGHQSEPKVLFIKVADAVSGMSPPAEPSGSIPVMHAKSKTFELTYELENKGPSGVKRINVWKMRPGFAWQRCSEFGEGDKPSVAVTVEASGRWGFRLIPQNGVGLAEPDPKRGDPPDIWVEVDDSKPQVSVTNVTVTPSPEGGVVTVYWKASDTFLRATPITLWYSTAVQGAPWTPIARDLPNTGSWTEQIKDLKPRIEDRYEFYLKVTADDEAGNRGEAQWREIVKVDLQIPRIKSIKLQPREPAAGDDPQSKRVPPVRIPQYGIQTPVDKPLFGGLPETTPASRPGSPVNGTNGGFSSPKP